MSDVEKLLIKAQPGCRITVKEHIDRGERIMGVIQSRFPEVENVYGLKAKHLRWFLHVHCSQYSETTRYHYFRTIRVIASALGKWGDWKSYVNGPWVRTGQGRPPKLAKRQS